jgi:hypothetical protein
MITDEMVEKARTAYFEAMHGSLDRHVNAAAMRAALEAVEPLISNAAAERVLTLDAHYWRD